MTRLEARSGVATRLQSLPGPLPFFSDGYRELRLVPEHKHEHAQDSTDTAADGSAEAEEALSRSTIAYWDSCSV